MSKIVATFDTVNKTMDVTIDGKKVDNATDVNMCLMGGGMMGGYDMADAEKEFSCSICTMMKDEQNDTSMMTRLMASNSAAAKKAIAESRDKPSDFPGFIKVSELNKAQLDTHKFFGVK